MGIQAIAQQRVADRQHMDAQLVRPAGNRRQFYAAVIAATLQHFPEGQRVFAKLVVDHVPGLGRRVVTQGQVDAATVELGLTPGQRGIGLFGFTVVKLTGQFAVSVSITGQQNDPGGFPVQTVDDARFGVAVFLQAGDEAVLVVIGPAGHRQQQGGFVDHQDASVLVDDVNIGQRH